MAVTEGVISGNLVDISRDDVRIGCGTNAELTIDNEQVETTCKDNDGARTYTPGSQNWGMTFQGNLKFDGVEGYRQIAALAKTRATAEFRYGTTNTDDPFWIGDGFISNLTTTGDVNAPATWSATVSPRGPIYLFNT